MPKRIARLVTGFSAASMTLLAVSGTMTTIGAQSSFDFNSSASGNFQTTQPQPPQQPAVPVRPGPTLAPPDDTGFQQYLQCMQQAVQAQESTLHQAQQSYHQQYDQLVQQRGQARLQVWTILDDRQRRSYEREVDRFYRDQFRQLDRAFDDFGDEVNDEYRRAKRECDRMRREIERQIRDEERQNRRSSSSRSSSSSSSRFSSGGTTGGGTNCQPYICSDGRTYPSCTPEGYPINYIVNPCTVY